MVVSGLEYNHWMPAAYVRADGIFARRHARYLLLQHSAQHRDDMAVYNRYAYGKEMRDVVANWANELLATEKMYYTCKDSPIVVPGGGGVELPRAA